MSKWIAEFELEDGDTMPEHMDLNYMGARIDFHCRPLEPDPKTGHWECKELFYDGESRGAIITCSKCGNELKVSPKVFENLYSNERFCNHCGCRMESEG